MWPFGDCSVTNPNSHDLEMIDLSLTLSIYLTITHFPFTTPFTL